MSKNSMNVEELSIYLNISISNIRNMVRSKRIPHYRIGRCIYFRINTIDEWLKNLEEQQARKSVFY